MTQQLQPDSSATASSDTSAPPSDAAVVAGSDNALLATLLDSLRRGLYTPAQCVLKAFEVGLLAGELKGLMRAQNIIGKGAIE